MHAGFVSYQLRKELTQIVSQAHRSNGGDEDGALSSAIAKLSSDGRLTGKSLNRVAATLGIRVPTEVGEIVLAEMCDQSITNRSGKIVESGESKTGGEDDQGDQVGFRVGWPKWFVGRFVCDKLIFSNPILYIKRSARRNIT